MSNKKIIRRINYLLGFFLVRPRRWFFRKLLWNSDLNLKFERNYFLYGKHRYPNPHWWILYKTVFKFFKWLDDEAWRPFCDWTGGFRRTYPPIARIIHKIGRTTAGYTIWGSECYHCGSEDGNPIHLADDDSGEKFKLIRAWTVSTQDGTDHRFCGTTICPNCGYQDYYEDGSL